MRNKNKLLGIGIVYILIFLSVIYRTNINADYYIDDIRDEINRKIMLEEENGKEIILDSIQVNDPIMINGTYYMVYSYEYISNDLPEGLKDTKAGGALKELISNHSYQVVMLTKIKENWLKSSFRLDNQLGVVQLLDDGDKKRLITHGVYQDIIFGTFDETRVGKLVFYEENNQNITEQTTLYEGNSFIIKMDKLKERFNKIEIYDIYGGLLDTMLIDYP